MLDFNEKLNLNSESFRAIESSQMGMTMHMLCSAFLHLTDSVSSHLVIIFFSI